MSMRKCKVCETFRGFRGFDAGHDTCKQCEQKIREYDWTVNKIPSMKECHRCGEEKNEFTAFLRVRGKLVGNICNQCKREEHRKRYKVDRTIYCNWSFQWEFQMVCKKCGEIKPNKDMIRQKHACKKCLGVVPQGVYNKDDFELKLTSVEDIVAREERMFTKQARREKFVREFNQRFGMSA